MTEKKPAPSPVRQLLARIAAGTITHADHRLLRNMQVPFVFAALGATGGTFGIGWAVALLFLLAVVGSNLDMSARAACLECTPRDGDDSPVQSSPPNP